MRRLIQRAGTTLIPMAPLNGRYNYNFRTNINWLGQTNGYLGKVNVDVQPARFAADRPECSLNLQTPCMQDGTLVSTMPAVQPLSFNVIDFSSFYQNYVGYPPTNAVSQQSPAAVTCHALLPATIAHVAGLCRAFYLTGDITVRKGLAKQMEMMPFRTVVFHNPVKAHHTDL